MPKRKHEPTTAAKITEREYTFTVELHYQGKLMETGSKTLKAMQLLDPDQPFPVQARLWQGKPPTWWRQMMRTEELDSCQLRVKVEKPSGESVGLFVGDICDGDDDETSFGLRSLPSALPDSEATDARMGITLRHSGLCCGELLTWDDESADVVDFDGMPRLKYLADELPWASTLKWYVVESYF